MSEKLKKEKWLWICPLVLVVAVAAIWLGLRYLPAGVLPSSADVRFSSVDANGLVEPDSIIFIGGKSNKAADELREHIAFDPPVPFTLRLDSATGDYIVTPTLPLAAGQKVALKVDGQTTQFTTAPTLVATGISPRNGSTGMDCWQGITMNLPVDMETLDLSAINAAASIQPPVKLRVSTDLGMLYIFPDDQLQNGVTYTFTLNNSFTVGEGLRLREPVTVTFTTKSLLEENGERMFQLSGNNPVYNTLPDDAPQIEVTIDETLFVDAAPPAVEVSLYTLPDEARYVTELQTAYKANPTLYSGIYTYQPTSLEGLAVHATFSATPFLQDNITEGYSRGRSMIPFPSKLDTGRYIMEFSLPTKDTNPDGTPFVLKRYQLLQVSPLSVFFMHNNDDLALWVNDTVTGQPVADARFEMWGQVNGHGITGANGVAQINDPALATTEWHASSIFSIQNGDHTYLDGRLFGMDYNYGDPNIDFASYLFTDRPIYMTTDKVQVWGVIRQRPASQIPAPAFTLDLWQGGIEPVTVTPDADGFFRTDIAIENLSPGWNQLRLLADGEEMMMVSIRIYDYVKPVYTSTSAPTQPVFVTSRGEHPALNLSVSLFDGTPVEGYKAKGGQLYYEDITCQPQEIVTDALGNASTRVTVTTPLESWWPRPYEYTFTSGEDENYVSSGYIHVIHRDLMLRGEAVRKGNTADVTVTTNQIDTTRVAGPEDLTTEKLRGAGVDTTVEAQLVRVEHTKTQIGTSYDYINRVSVPRYRYDQVDVPVEKYTLETVGGKATLPGLPAKDDKGSYKLVLSALDSAGLNTLYTLWLDIYPDAPGTNSTPYYSLSKQLDPTKLEGEETADGFDYGYAWNTKYSFGDGEDVVFNLVDRDIPVTQTKGRMLTATVQQGIGNLSVVESNQVTLPFQESLVPNYDILGAYFDGRYIYLIDKTSMNFQHEDRQLDIALQSDKEVYGPGDSVTVTAKVTRSIDGQPAPDSTLLLSVVDEAIFALNEQDISFLERYYRYAYSPYITCYLSFNGPGYNGPGEKGGGGDDKPIREKFEDTAHFNTAVTDASGTATFSFTLPDNITSWRLTALTLDKKNFVGSYKQNVISTKDFYLLPKVTAQLVEGDSLTVGLKGGGNAVTNEDEVDYTVTLDGPVTGSQTLSGLLRQDSWATFHALTPGDYTVTIQGRSKDFSDSVRLPVTVVPTGLEVNRSQTFDLAQGIQVDSLRWPVTVNLYDKRYVTYNRVIQSLQGYQSSPRNDARIAQKVVYDLLAKQGDVSHLPVPASITDIQENGWVSPLPYAEWDFDLTAGIYLAVPQLFPIQRMQYRVSSGTAHLENYGDGYSGTHTAHYMLQAMLGFYDAKAAALGDYGYVEQLNLAIANLLAGDKNAAEKVYQTLVADKKQTLTGVTGETALYIPQQDKNNETDCTAAALRLALLLEKPDAHGFMSHLLNKPSPYNPYIAEQLLYLSRYQPTPGDPVQVRYAMDGQQQTVTLSGAMHTLVLSQEALKAADFQAVAGQAFADVYYTVRPQDADPAQQKLKITRTIETLDGGPMRVGAQVKVTLTPDFSGIAKGVGDSLVYIDDYLPTGLRFEQFDQPESFLYGAFWLDSQNGQRLRFTANSDNYRFQQVVYYARCALPGTYTQEGPFVTPVEGGAWGIGQQDTLTIQP